MKGTAAIILFLLLLASPAMAADTCPAICPENPDGLCLYEMQTKAEKLKNLRIAEKRTLEQLKMIREKIRKLEEKTQNVGGGIK
jgi:Skp family chaperone for outer membrane proteins